MIKELALSGMVCLLGVMQMAAQDTQTDPDGRWFHLGLRVSVVPLKSFDVSTVDKSTTNPVADYNYTGTNVTHRMMAGPVGEVRIWKKLSLVTEVDFHQAEYQQTTEKRLGHLDTTASTDTRNVYKLVETTKANYWDIPVLLRYRGFTKDGFRSKMYVTGGPSLRHIGGIRTGNEITNFDSSTDYNETAAKPEKTNQIGVALGVGFRAIDEVGIRLTPEVRFTRWFGNSFSGTAFRSVQNQVEVGIGFSF
jgi:hypothetical protein